MPTLLKSIYSFNNYRVFLKEYYLYQKSTNKSFTLAFFARQAKLGSANYLQLVIKGKRNLTITNIHKFASAMTLDLDERKFFETLVLHNQAEDSDIKKYYQQRLRDLKKTKPKHRGHTCLQNLINRWYYPAIIVALEGRGPKDLTEISKLVGIPLSEVKNAIQGFLRDHVVKIEQEEFKLNSDHFIFQDRRVTRQQQKKYLADQLKLSQKMLESRYPEPAKFFSHTFTMDKRLFNKHVDEIQAFIDQLTTQTNSEKPNEISQLNIQFFPLQGSN